MDGAGILVTGAGRGMGRAMARALTAAGAAVVAVDRDRDPLHEVGSGLDPGAIADRWMPVVADVSDPDDVRTIVDATVQRFGAVAALVNNAGLPKFLPGGNGPPGRRRRLWETEPAEFEHYLAVHAVGPFLLARAVVPHMLEAGHGRIVTVTTNLHTMVSAGSGPYGPSKAAEEALTAILAAELTGTGITANVLIPGAKVNTRPGQGSGDVPSADLLEPEVMVAPLLWLLSEASASATGRRFKATDWEESIPPDAAASLASKRIAWSEQPHRAATVDSSEKDDHVLRR